MVTAEFDQEAGKYRFHTHKAFGLVDDVYKEEGLLTRAAGLDAFHTEDMDALIRWARAEVHPPDVLLVKGSRGMKPERLVEALRAPLGPGPRPLPSHT